MRILSSMILVAPILSAALSGCASRSADVKPALDPQVNLSCATGGDCAMLGAVGVVSAITGIEKKNKDFRPDRRDDSIVLKCEIKRPESDMRFSCGTVSVVWQRHGSPARETKQFRGGFVSIPVPSRDEEYDLEVSTKSCGVPELVRGARAGEVWTITFELPCDPAGVPPAH